MAILLQKQSVGLVERMVINVERSMTVLRGGELPIIVYGM